MRKFTNKQLENLLKTSTKNVAHEVVATLIDLHSGPGILMELETSFNLNLKAIQEEQKSALPETENSMANAETEDEDVTFLRNNKGGLLKKKTSKAYLLKSDDSY